MNLFIRNFLLGDNCYEILNKTGSIRFSNIHTTDKGACALNSFQSATLGIPVTRKVKDDIISDQNKALQISAVRVFINLTWNLLLKTIQKTNLFMT